MMEITSFHFLLFVLVVLIVYHNLPYRVQNIWLLIASYVFYIVWSWKFAVLLAFATVFHFELAKKLRKDGKSRAGLLWFGVIANVILFIIFKAASFYVHRLVRLFGEMGIESGLSGLEIIVPLGLSYYILQNISYLIDVYRGQIPASTNRVDFALYLAFFPKMVAGPIERAKTFLPILACPRRVDNELFARSVALILVGLIRKLVFANLLFAHTPWRELYSDPTAFSKAELLGWLVVYSFGLYNDFAGYTSIVRGVSGLFGIELSPNFNLPYFARTFTEFWNRWHITLSHWLRDYIFFPVSRTLARRFPDHNAWQNLILPPLVTMLVSGIWHKPNWQMLMWGGLHGSYLVMERLLMLWKPEWFHGRKHYINWLSTSMVFLLVTLAWAPFSMGISSALNVWSQLRSGNLFGLTNTRLLVSLTVLIVALWLDWMQAQKNDEVFFLQKHWTLQALWLGTVIILLLIVTDSGAGRPFVYQGF